MADLVEQTRDLNPWTDMHWPEKLQEAASEIERLRTTLAAKEKEIEHLRSELTAAREAEAKMREALESVASYAWRTDPPNANRPFTVSDRFSAIKHHPTIKRFAQPHIELAAREAATLPHGDGEGGGV